MSGLQGTRYCPVEGKGATAALASGFVDISYIFANADGAVQAKSQPSRLAGLFSPSNHRLISAAKQNQRIRGRRRTRRP